MRTLKRAALGLCSVVAIVLGVLSIALMLVTRLEMPMSCGETRANLTLKDGEMFTNLWLYLDESTPRPRCTLVDFPQCFRMEHRLRVMSECRSASTILRLKRHVFQIDVSMPGFMVWLAFGVFAVWPVWWSISVVRDLRRRIAGDRCRSCGYNLTGNISGVCPECSCATKLGKGGVHDGTAS